VDPKKLLTLTLTQDEMECVVRWAGRSLKQPDPPAAAWIINEATKKQCVGWVFGSVREKTQAKVNEVEPVVTPAPAYIPPGEIPPGYTLSPGGAYLKAVDDKGESIHNLALVFRSIKPLTIHTFAHIWNQGDGPRDFLAAIGVPVTKRSLQAASMTAYRLRREGRDIRRGTRGAKLKGGK